MAAAAPTRILPRTATLAGLFALALLAACQSPTDANRAAIETLFGKLRALEAPVTSAPAVTEDRIDTAGARVVLEGEGANALFVAGIHLAKPEEGGPYGPGAKHAVPLETCARALAGETPFRSESEVARHLRQCATAQYAFVLRTIREEYARLVDDKHYTPGSYEGEVLLYRLEDAMLLGGFRLSARNGDRLEVLVGQHGLDAEATNALVNEVRDQVQAQVDAGLRTHVPGSLP